MQLSKSDLQQKQSYILQYEITAEKIRTFMQKLSKVFS